MTIYALKINGSWATGEFDRCYPPNPYVGDWKDAEIFTEYAAAEVFVMMLENDNVEIVEFECKRI